jgi:hypothetical protein
MSAAELSFSQGPRLRLLSDSPPDSSVKATYRGTIQTISILGLRISKTDTRILSNYETVVKWQVYGIQHPMIKNDS